MKDTLNIAKSVAEFGLLIKGNSETVKNEGKSKKVDFFQCYQERQLLVSQEIP